MGNALAERKARRPWLTREDLCRDQLIICGRCGCEHAHLTPIGCLCLRCTFGHECPDCARDKAMLETVERGEMLR
jgi:hypothetical protein